MGRSKPACEKCGAPAVVHITNDTGDGAFVRHLCIPCADEEEATVARGKRGLDHAAILIVVGLLLLVISAGADILKFGSAEEFGMWQIIGTLLGGFLAIVGAVMRISTVVVIGLITIGLTVLADWLGFGNAEGFGLQQIAGCALGVVLILAGLAVGRSQPILPT